MKLSEAIRLGAMLKPQCRGEFYKDGKTCALGAALDASGIGDFGLKYASDDDVVDRWPISDLRIQRHGLTRTLRNHIVRLNDSDRWTREQIADWVATIEAQNEAPTAEPTPIEAAVSHGRLRQR
jgi:hypothetical protein